MLSDKKLAQIEKTLSRDGMEFLESMLPEGLTDLIAESAGAIKQAQDELEANPKFLELKDSLKACSEGLREVKKRQNARIQYALHLLEEKGKV